MKTLQISLALFVFSAVLFDEAFGITTCPTPSANSLSCLSGYTASSWPTTGGKCTCLCGADSNTADSDYSTLTYAHVDTFFAAAAPAGCSALICSTKFPNACTKGYVNATYMSWGAVKALNLPVVSAAVSPSTNQYCLSYSYTCPTSTYNCSDGNPGPAIITSYGGFQGNQQSCNSVAQAYATIAPVFTVCNTTNCNAVPTANVLTCCLGSACAGGKSNDAATCAALGDLYMSTNGASWMDNACYGADPSQCTSSGGWAAAAAGVPTDFCKPGSSFYGVVCDGGVVTSLCVRLTCHLRCSTRKTTQL